jgi:hypothetical protein
MLHYLLIFDGRLGVFGEGVLNCFVPVIAALVQGFCGYLLAEAKVHDVGDVLFFWFIPEKVLQHF